MGGWNGTCMLSGLAICSGEDAVAIPVIQTKRGDLGTLFPVFGEYNDYTLQDVREDVSTKFVLSIVNKKLVEAHEEPIVLTSEEKARCKVLDDKACELTLTDEEQAEFIALTHKQERSYYDHRETLRISDHCDAGLTSDCNEFDSIEALLQAFERGGHGAVVDIELYDFSEGPSWNTITLNLIHRKVWDAVMGNILNACDAYVIYAHSLSEALAFKYGLGSNDYRRVSGELAFQLELDKVREASDSIEAAELLDAMPRFYTARYGNDFNSAPKVEQEAWLDNYRAAVSKGVVISRRSKMVRVGDIEFLTQKERDSLAPLSHKHVMHAMQESFLREIDHIGHKPVFVTEIAEAIATQGLAAWEDALRNLFVLTHGIYALRKNFSVMSGAGSSADAHKTVAAMARAIIEVSTERDSNNAWEDD